MQDTDLIQKIEATSQACRTLDPIPHTFEADNQTTAFEPKGDGRHNGFGFFGGCFDRDAAALPRDLFLLDTLAMLLFGQISNSSHV